MYIHYTRTLIGYPSALGSIQNAHDASPLLAPGNSLSHHSLLEHTYIYTNAQLSMPLGGLPLTALTLHNYHAT